MQSQFHSDRQYIYGDDLILVTLTARQSETWVTVAHKGGTLLRYDLPGIDSQTDADNASRDAILAGMNELAGTNRRSSDMNICAPAGRA